MVLITRDNHCVVLVTRPREGDEDRLVPRFKVMLNFLNTPEKLEQKKLIFLLFLHTCCALKCIADQKEVIVLAVCHSKTTSPWCITPFAPIFWSALFRLFLYCVNRAQSQRCDENMWVRYTRLGKTLSCLPTRCLPYRPCTDRKLIQYSEPLPLPH